MLRLVDFQTEGIFGGGLTVRQGKSDGHILSIIYYMSVHVLSWCLF